MKLSLAIPLGILGALALAALATFGLAVADLRGDGHVRELWVWAGRAWTGLCGLIPLLIGAASFLGLVLGLFYAAGWIKYHVPLIYPRFGQLPAVANPRIQLVADYHSEKVAVARAVFAGPEHGDSTRISAAVARQILNPRQDEALLPEPAGTAMISVEEALAVDPLRNPHLMAIGASGSGKTHAIYLLLERLTRQYHAEVLILERDGINWNEQAAAVTSDGYVDALQNIEQERLRRVDLLRGEDVDHVSKLALALPYLIVLIAEAENVYSDLSVRNRNLAREYTVLLRTLASMGRKQGILLVIETQSGTSNVFDTSTRKNFSKLFFRTEPGVGDAWGIPRSVGLERLESGTAYSLEHGGLVVFPQTVRPRLPLSRIFQEPRLQLPADAAADGLGADDLPDGATVYAAATRYMTTAAVPVPVPSTYAVEAPQEEGPAGTVPVPGAPPKLAVPTGLPDAAVCALIYTTWLSCGRNINRTQQILFDLEPDSHGGQPWLICIYAINRALGHLRYGAHSPVYADWLARQQRQP